MVVEVVDVMDRVEEEVKNEAMVVVEEQCMVVVMVMIVV